MEMHNLLFSQVSSVLHLASSLPVDSPFNALWLVPLHLPMPI